MFKGETLKKILLVNQYSYPYDIIDKSNLKVSDACIDLLK